MRKAKRRYKNQVEWERIAGDYVDSGLSQRDFCKGLGIGPSSLRWALKRIRDREESREQPVELIEVSAQSGSNFRRNQDDGAPYEVIFQSGLRLRISKGFAPDELRQLIKAMEG